jgi:hypothetical protein
MSKLKSTYVEVHRYVQHPKMICSGLALHQVLVMSLYKCCIDDLNTYILL